MDKTKVIDSLIAAPITVERNTVIRQTWENEQGHQVVLAYSPLASYPKAPFSVEVFSVPLAEGEPEYVVSAPTIGRALMEASYDVGFIRPQLIARSLLQDALALEERGWVITDISEPFQRVYESAVEIRAFWKKHSSYHISLANESGTVITVSGGEGANLFSETEIGGEELNRWNWHPLLSRKVIPDLSEVVTVAEEHINEVSC
jgi:hypothetical protein